MVVFMIFIFGFIGSDRLRDILIFVRVDVLRV